MDWTPLPLRAPLEAYVAQAARLLEAWRAGDADAIRFFKERHPRFLREDVPWLSRPLSEQRHRGSGPRRGRRTARHRTRL